MHLTVGNAIDPETGDRQTLPWEYTELRLCRLYGCRPSELDQEAYGRIAYHIELLNAEAEAEELKAEW